MKGSKGTHDLDGSELDNKTISLHDQFSTQLSLSSSNDVIMNRKDAATSLGTDKEIPSAIPHWPLKSVKQDATEEERLHKNKLSSGKKNIEPRRGTVSLDAKGTRASQDKIQKAASVPSRLSRTIKASSKHQQVSNFEKKRPPHLKIGTPGKVRSPQLWADNLPRREIEAGNIQNVADKKSPIEELIGLDEFDGHEGISSDSSDYQFSLWLSPR
ncbi:uncharacterized protein LOC133906730 isoform X2 [Phragmites australis]|uniref:uncharacterized protein LOC133906730 isoform X2 n=1 Tax=Phragmites australis TaxID=29695 RepID=UPI002D7A0FEE|nr:uncharacterized protein LOC133906730 isoform X2 [Phragmites australis]